MAPDDDDDDDDVLDAWRSCGHAVRVKTLDVVVDGASDEGEDSTSTTVRVRIGTKDVTRDAREVEVDPYFFDRGYSAAASTGFARVWEGAEALSAFLRRAPERCRGKRCLLYTSPSPRDYAASRMPSSA